ATLLERQGTAHTSTLSPQDLSERSLAEVDVLLIGEACAVQAAAPIIDAWVRKGGALVSFANASACDDPVYSNMLGVHSDGVSPVTPFNGNVSDAGHEITRGFHDFHVIDHFLFLRKSGEADLHWLLSGNWQGQLMPLAYVREYGQGRVFYTAL